MKFRVAISLLAICLASPAITSGEQAQRGRGYRPRDGSAAQPTAKSGDGNRGGGDRERTATANTRPAERRAESGAEQRRATSRREEGRDENRAEPARTESRQEERRAENRDNDRDDQPQRYAVPRDNRPVNVGGRDYRSRDRVPGFGDRVPGFATRGYPGININIGSSYRGYYAPVHYDYWARRYYRWSPIGYAPWSLIYGSMGFSNFGYYGGVGPNPFDYGYSGYGPGSYSYSPWQASGYDAGGIRLDVRPRDAQVFVDGYYAGLVDDFDGLFQSLRLDSGGHKVEIHMPGYEDFELDVHVQPGRKFTISADLQRRP